MANSIVSQHVPSVQVNISTEEIGRDSINELYRRTQLPVLVDDELSFATTGGFETSGTDWRAYNTAVKLNALRYLLARPNTGLVRPRH
jgi:hypothetical protein